MGVSFKDVRALLPIIRLAKLFDNLVVFRKATHLVLREKKITFCRDIENAVISFDKLRFDSEFIGYLGRQTGGLWEIVSRYAVSNLYFHLFPPFLSLVSGFCLKEQQKVDSSDHSEKCFPSCIFP